MALWNKNDQGKFGGYKSSHAGLTVQELTMPLIMIEKP